MGQRLSIFKNLFAIMDHENSVNVGEDVEENENFLFPATENVDNMVENSLIHRNDNSGNEHFESIYGTASHAVSVNSSTSSLQDEENGNFDPPTFEPVTPPADNDQNSGSPKTLPLSNTKKLRAKPVQTSKEKKKMSHWVLKFNCARSRAGCGGVSSSSESYIPEPHLSYDSCICTGYRRTDEHHLGAGVVLESSLGAERQTSVSPEPQPSCSHDVLGASSTVPENPINPVIDLSKFNPDDFPIEDCDERARLERAREIAEGVEPPPGFQPGKQIQLLCPPDFIIDNLKVLFQTHLGLSASALAPALAQLDFPTALPSAQRMIHTQVDYIHCLVPDILQITSCSFYWGKMDRYEAERLLDGRPEGTFLLRDSAQEEYLFSVSFRRYGRSLHARIEQWNHRFSFDSHDPGVFASTTVCGLIEHYKDPSCCMFFEPMLTIPLHRNFPFSLQHLCRAVVSSRSTYDGVNQLSLPKALKSYLKEYHYKQRVRVRRFDIEH